MLDAASFVRWRRLMGFSQEQAAEALGLSTRTISSYENGSYPISKTASLACGALALGLDDYTGANIPA